MERPLVRHLRGEHTYVISDAGHRWACHGSADGGRETCVGSGHADLAACLAQPNALAGIIYGVTGVCHQIANRILWPADVRVDQAIGYRFSSAVYGQYGALSWHWPQLDICCQALGMERLLAEWRGRTMGVPPRTPRELEEPEVAYVIESTEKDHFVEERVAELVLLIEQHLGRDFDRRRRAAIERIRTASAQEQFDLLSAAEQGALGAEVYLQRFTALLQRTFADIDRVLGRADFERVFGGPPEDALGIIDRDAYARARGLRSS